MTTTPRVTGQLDRALAATAEIVARIADGQWALPTCCTEWNVRQLLNHVAGGNLGFAAVLREHESPAWTDDHLGADPVSAYLDRYGWAGPLPTRW